MRSWLIFRQEFLPYIYGLVLFLAFPALLLIQNTLVALAVNLKNFKRDEEWIIKVFKRLKTISRTNVSLFFSLDLFSAERVVSIREGYIPAID